MKLKSQLNVVDTTSSALDSSLSTEHQDYCFPLSTEHQDLVDEMTCDIKDLVRRTAHSLIDIGNKLEQTKQILGHGNFTKWLRREFNWSIATASKMMQVSKRFKNVNFTNLNLAPSAIYLLAAPSTPESARTEALSRASEGESITYSVARGLVRHHKALIRLDLEDKKEVQANSQKILSFPEGRDSNQNLDGLTLINMTEPINILDAIFDLNSIAKPTSLVELKFFQRQFISEWLRMSREKNYMSIVFCIIDNLQSKNDQIVDSEARVEEESVIQAINETLKRPGDLFTYAQIGMFLLLLPSTTIQGAISVAKTIKANVITSESQAYNDSNGLREGLILRLFAHSLLPSRELPSKNFFNEILLKHEVLE